jgi:hypothetical protein
MKARLIGAAFPGSAVLGAARRSVNLLTQRSHSTEWHEPFPPWPQRTSDWLSVEYIEYHAMPGIEKDGEDKGQPVQTSVKGGPMSPSSVAEPGPLGGPRHARRRVVLDELDDLCPPAGLDVQVDVGRPGPLWGKEPFERRLVLHRAEQSGVLVLIVERLVGAGRESVQPGMAGGWSGSADGRDVPDHAFRGRMAAMARSAAAGSPRPSGPTAGSSIVNMRVVSIYERRRRVGGCRSWDDRAVKTKECSHGTFGWHG